MFIRDATVSDTDHVQHLIELLEDRTFNRDAFAFQFKLNLLDPRTAYLVAVSEGTVVGFGSLSIHRPLHHDGPIAEIVELVVDENRRGEGIGRLIMDRLLSIALEWGCRCVDIDSNRNRERAHRFYVKNGFELTHVKLTMDTRAL